MNLSGKITEQLLVLVGSYVFFLCTLAANLSAPHDSIAYLNGIAGGYGLFHQHHLIYHWTTHYWLVFIREIFPHIKDYYLVEAYTALWGSGSLLMAYKIFRNRFELPALTSVIGISVIAFSYGFWFYSVNIEVYAPPMCLLLMALYILTKKNFALSDVWKVALLHSLAVLFHQINVLFAVIILYKLFQQRKNIKAWNGVLQYTMIGVVLVGGAYFVVGWIVEGHSNFAGWMDWIQGYAHNNSYWRPLSIKTPMYVATGFSHALIGGHYIFQAPVVSDYLNAAAADHSLSDEIYLGRHISETTAVILTILSLLLAVLILWLAINFIRRYKSIYSKYGKVTTPLLLTGFVYAGFFCFWEPDILEFWLFQTILLWILLIGALPVTRFPFHLRNTVGVFTLSLLLFIVNYFGSVRWLLDMRNDWYYRLIEPIKEKATPKDLVLMQDGWILKDFATYFTKAQVLWVEDKEKTGLDSAVANCLNQGGKIYIYPEHRKIPMVSDTKYIDSLLTARAAHTRVLSKEKPSILEITD